MYGHGEYGSRTYGGLVTGVNIQVHESISIEEWLIDLCVDFTRHIRFANDLISVLESINPSLDVLVPEIYDSILQT
jgi:hypothetical protein